MQQVLIYRKKCHTKDNREFFKYLLSYRGKTYNCNFKNETKEKFLNDIKVSNLDYPVFVDLEDKDYFIKKEKRITKDGEAYDNHIVCIMAYQRLSEGTYPKGKTLDMLDRETHL